MNIQDYISSGILQGYCLDILGAEARTEVEKMCRIYPEIKAELRNVELAMEEFAIAHAELPAEEMQEQIWDILENLNKEQVMDINDLPLVNRFSDHRQWLGLVKPFMPAEVVEDRTMQVLKHTDKITQLFVVSKTDLEEEVHDDISESFLILEGECECTVGENVFSLGPGGFTEIPLNVPHSVRALTPYVSVIVQHVAV